MQALHQKLLNLLGKISWLPPLLARITIGAVFLESGWGKLHNIEKVVAYFTGLGIPSPQLLVPFVSMVEFVCGCAILLGLLTRLASVPLVCTMTVAIITAKRDAITEWTDVFSFSEYLYIVLLIWLIFSGPGMLSLDRLFFKKRGP
jgi:putative oxidoreductase